tara:strand:- start:4365 stop:4559 length:195 start_codon:yes stop_codon:yes gene_type:complete
MAVDAVEAGAVFASAVAFDEFCAAFVAGGGVSEEEAGGSGFAAVVSVGHGFRVHPPFGTPGKHA